MPGPYGSIGSLDLGRLDTLVPLMQGCPGGRVMLKLTDPAEEKPALNMPRLMNALHGELLSCGWTWSPSEGGGAGSGPAILDWTRTSGECQYVARALALLLTAPRPLGFAIAEEHVTCEKYEGVEKNGFAAAHADGTLRTRCNVWAPARTRIHPGLRRWGDHWVVHVKDKYWDACYNQAYSALGDMALVEFVGEPVVSMQGKMPVLSQRGVSRTRPELNGFYRTVAQGTPEGNAGAAFAGPFPR